MRAVDTNVLVRLIARDDARQAAAADKFIESGAWISTLVLAETVWVLQSVYERKPGQIADAIELLLNHAHLSLQDADIVETALTMFRAKPALGFTDSLIVEITRKNGHQPLGTFDRSLGGVEGAHRIS